MAGNGKGIGARTERGHNAHTYSGEPFFPFDPQPEDIRLEDIAHSLSMQCRFNGHCLEFYSVAQHSVLVCRNVPQEFKAEALLHDAAEAYIGDLVSPVKAHCPDWQSIDRKLDAVIRQRFGLPESMSPEVHRADFEAVVTEKRDLLTPTTRVDWGDDLPEPWPEEINPWDWKLARWSFLQCARKLGVT